MDKGWIKLHRKTLESRVFQSEGLLKVWIWCLLKANHEGRWVSIRTGRGVSEVRVERGQFIFGRKSAAKQLKMPSSTVWKRIRKLENMRNCDIESDRHYSLVTIANWELYQGDQKKVTAKVTGKEQPSDTNKNYENEENTLSVKKTDPRIRGFFDFWGREFTQICHEKYTFNGNKEAALVKKLLKVDDLPRLQQLAVYFLKSKEKWICDEAGKTIGVFYSQINKLKIKCLREPEYEPF